MASRCGRVERSLTSWRAFQRATVRLWMPSSRAQRTVRGGALLDVGAAPRGRGGIGVQFEIHQSVPPSNARSRRRGRPAGTLAPVGLPLPPNTLAEPQRDMARLSFVVSQTREIKGARQKRLEQQPETGPDAMVRRLARRIGVGVETADMLIDELLSRPMRDRPAVARGACPRAGQRLDPGAGLTGSPDESGAQRREQGLAKPAPGENRGPATPGSAAA